MYPELRRRDLGICGTMIVLCHGLVSLHSNQSLTDKLDNLKDEINNSKTHIEQFFVKKTDMENLSNKLEKMTDQLANINVKVISLKAFLKDQFEMDDEDVSCRNEDLKVAKGGF